MRNTDNEMDEAVRKDAAMDGRFIDRPVVRMPLDLPAVGLEPTVPCGTTVFSPKANYRSPKSPMFLEWNTDWMDDS